MESINKDDLMFYVTKESIQINATRLVGRELNEDELYSVKKGLEWGLTYDLENIISTSINDAISNNS